MVFCDVCPITERGEKCERCQNLQIGPVTGKVFWQSSSPEYFIAYYRQEGIIPPNSEVVISSDISWKSSPRRLAQQVRQLLREYDSLFFEKLPEKVLNIMSQQPGFLGQGSNA
ncbi:MAG: hypothetical protein A3J76_00800 [Candidatus Moranbacteria bacterium RBG_13_45_13]|nr:MAG: hypothetical protein A3J76_00800 [Candidatus Moranbacteria bacterium RBG_13_45_13]